MLHFSGMTFGVNTMTWGIVSIPPLNYGPCGKVPLKDFTRFAVESFCRLEVGGLKNGSDRSAEFYADAIVSYLANVDDVYVLDMQLLMRMLVRTVTIYMNEDFRAMPRYALEEIERTPALWWMLLSCLPMHTWMETTRRDKLTIKLHNKLDESRQRLSQMGFREAVFQIKKVQYAVDNEDVLWKVRLAIGVVVGTTYTLDGESPRDLMPLVRKWNVLSRSNKQPMTYARKE